MTVVRRSSPKDVPACVHIVRGLPEYFTDDVPEKVEREAQPGNPSAFYVAALRPTRRCFSLGGASG